MILDGIVDYKKLDWKKTLQQITYVHIVEAMFLETFGNLWCLHFTFFFKGQYRVRWSYQLPEMIYLAD
jgi:hypothetical protein